MPENTESPVTVKTWRIDRDDAWHEIGGYLDEVIARAALVEVLGKAAEGLIGLTGYRLMRDVERFAAGEIAVVWVGDDQYLLDNPQARVDAGRARKCPRCCEMVDDSRWANEPCARCVGEDIGADELEASRERLAAFEALRPDVEEFVRLTAALDGSASVGSWEDQADKALGLASYLAEIFGIKP